MPVRFVTVTRNGKTYRRKLLSKTAQRARIAKFRATMAATKRAGPDETDAPAAKRRGRPPKHAGKRNGAASEDPPSPGVLGMAHALENAMVHLKRGEDWLRAKWGGQELKNLDPAHVELINARNELRLAGVRER